MFFPFACSFTRWDSQHNPQTQLKAATYTPGIGQNVLTEISYLCIHVCIKQDVFRFQVPVDHHVPVTIIHTRKDLLEQTSTFLFIQLGKVEQYLKLCTILSNTSFNGNL